MSKWFLTGTPYPVIFIVTAYLAMVKYGPGLMKAREPFELCNAMRIYNIVQVVYNGYIVHYVCVNSLCTLIGMIIMLACYRCRILHKNILTVLKLLIHLFGCICK